MTTPHQHQRVEDCHLHNLEEDIRHAADVSDAVQIRLPSLISVDSKKEDWAYADPDAPPHCNLHLSTNN